MTDKHYHPDDEPNFSDEEAQRWIDSIPQTKKSEPPKLSEEEIKDMEYATYAREHPLESPNDSLRRKKNED